MALSPVKSSEVWGGPRGTAASLGPAGGRTVSQTVTQLLIHVARQPTGLCLLIERGGGPSRGQRVTVGCRGSPLLLLLWGTPGVTRVLHFGFLHPDQLWSQGWKAASLTLPAWGRGELWPRPPRPASARWSPTSQPPSPAISPLGWGPPGSGTLWVPDVKSPLGCQSCESLTPGGPILGAGLRIADPAGLGGPPGC